MHWHDQFIRTAYGVTSFLNKHDLEPENVKIVTFSTSTGTDAYHLFYKSAEKLEWDNW